MAEGSVQDARRDQEHKELEVEQLRSATDRFVADDNDSGDAIVYRDIIEQKGKVSLGERLNHVTWANYTLTMSTGGVALLLAQQPHTFRGLQTIGKVVFIFDLVLFLSISILITRRFIREPSALVRSLVHPTESLMFPTLLLSMAGIIANMQVYGYTHTGAWFVVMIRVCFWIYVATSFIVAVGQYWVLFQGRQLTVHSMTPAWLMPIFPSMLTGTVAASISHAQPFSERMPILVAGLAMQGLGFWVAVLMYGIFLMRLMESGPPKADMRPGMYIAVGPPSFTALALVDMSQALPGGYSFFQNHPAGVQILQTTAVAFAVMIWMLAFWFFCITSTSVLVTASKMSFHLVWWSFVFPNTGFTIATITIGRQLQSNAVTWVGSAMSIGLVVMYLFVLAAEIRAVIRGDIWYPGRDEDRTK